MAAAEIQVVNTENLQKIESFLNDSAYKDAIENSSNFNTRLCVERRLRMPFLDPQTGVAQNHCNLFMSRRQRMPGMREGQIYTYPSTRWRKARRQYLSLQRMGWGTSAWESAGGASAEAGGDDSSGLPGVDSAANEDSRDGEHSGLKDDPKDSWFYEDLVEDMEQAEDAEQESDEDYFDDTYANRRRGRGGGGGPGSAGGAGPGRRGRRGGGGRGAGAGASPAPPDDATPKGRGRAGGRGRRRAAQGTLPYEVAGDADKPYGCELCGARYKTRPGLTYHYTHSHKEGSAGAPSVASDGDSRDSGAAPSPAPAAPSPAPAAPTPAKEPPAIPSTPSSKDLASSEYQDSYVTFLNNPAAAAAAATSSTSSAVRRGRAPGASAGTSAAGASAGAGGATAAPPASSPPSAPVRAASPVVPVAPAVATANEDSNASDDSQTADTATKPDPAVRGKKDNASPSPYCDFCLGDNSENKKTHTPEDLVSCSDCGRSGHPTCLQFTVNMIVSVRKYRWQCIECKCCSVCGNSDNDDQLLFCDDCDRGYHMYCLAPPLAAPPEGSWSCKLCLQEFHGK